MNPRTLFLLLFISCSKVDGSVSSLFRSFLGGNSRILPAGHEKGAVETAPNTPMSSGRSAGGEARVIPVDYDEAPKLSADVSPLKILKRKSQPQPSTPNKETLMSLLKPFKVTRGFELLSEEGAGELCKIKEHLLNLYDPAGRNILLLMDWERSHPNNSKPRSSAPLPFSRAIGRDLEQVQTVKDLLRVAVKYYKACYRDLIFDSIVVGVMKSRLFTWQEVAEMTGMSFSNLFWFACVQNDTESAKQLLNLINRRDDVIYEALWEAYDLGHVALAEEIFEIVGKWESNQLYERLNTIFNK